MPKHDKFSPKGLAIRMKAKGLQKLRWYCEMCQKQCRDENGFKCHQTSDGHVRQMRLFAENPGRVMEKYSLEFEKNFLEVLSHRHGTKRVAANVVYQEYIADKQHVHMNATRWETLTTFCKYLGRAGQCLVDETERGWFIQWIDPAALARRRALEQRREAEADDEERRNGDLRRRVERAAAAAAAESHVEEATERLPGKGVSFAPPQRRATTRASLPRFLRESEKEEEAMMMPPQQKKKKKKARALDLLMQQEKKVRVDEEGWLLAGIVVKVMSREAGPSFYKKKGVVVGLASEFVAVVAMLDGDASRRLQVDQDDLETVIPAPGKCAVKLLRGKMRGEVGEVVAVDESKFGARVRVASTGEVVWVEYSDLSKYPSTFIGSDK
ncbi:hypothetical protein CTAYLR_009480 [Chrysophaeum taylorii]|uniref:C2H2-type domain-containing protein n=1 Tax=Chrysophaeum taylorii TaxID=2483200 RepID=A0AAD7XP79_9STRA|nr:hypothetical protein CTAYLR_009480 [Chrysophaeum taylorii]